MPPPPPGPTIGTRGDDQIAHKAGSGQGSASKGRVCEPDLLGSKKGSYTKTSDQLKTPQPFRSEATLQNGGSICSEGPAPEWRLDDLSRPKRCVSVSTDVARAQETPPFPVGQPALPVSVPPIRAMQRPTNVHEDIETSVGVIEAEGCTPSGVHRRYPPDDAIQRETDPGGPGITPTPTTAGFPHQLREVSSESMPGDHLSQLCGQLTTDGYQAPGGETAEYHFGLQKGSETGDGISERSSEGHREDDGSHTSNNTSTSLLQEPAAAQECSLQGYTELRVESTSGRLREGGTTMVDCRDTPVERKTHCHSNATHDDRNRCFPSGVGSDTGWSGDRGDMDKRRKKAPYYKLVGATRGCLCSEDIRQGQNQHPHTSEDGQYLCNCIHKSARRKRSQALSHCACQLWQWCLDRGITLSTEHLLGIFNCTADRESRTYYSSAEWKLDTTVCAQVIQ